MKTERGKSTIVYEQGYVDFEDPSTGHVAIVVNASGRTKPRTKEDLKRELEDVNVDSVEDVCEKFIVKIEGSYEGLDGKEKQASIPARSEETFTPQGLTVGDPELFRIFIEGEVCDHIARYLSERERDYLTKEEIAHLKKSLKLIESSLEGE